MSEYYKCCGCPKFENNEHCDDEIIFCEHELAEHDAKVIDDFINEILKLKIYKQVKNKYLLNGCRTDKGEE